MKYSIIIRFTNTTASSRHVGDLHIPLSVSMERDEINKLVTAKWIKTTIRNQVPDCENKRLRLIYNGRVLNENTDFKREIFDPKSKQLQQAGEHAEEEGLYIHCVIGEELTVEQLEQENQLDNVSQQRTTAPEVIGFDRLLQQGFTQEDIDDLRRQFQLIYGANLPTGPRTDQINDLEEEEHAQNNIRQLEERWIESTVNTTEGIPTTTTNSGEAPATVPNADPQAPAQPLSDLDDTHGNEDLLLGLLVGVFLGVVGLIFILGDDTMCNKRQKMSIIAGVVLNCMFAIVRGSWI